MAGTAALIQTLIMEGVNVEKFRVFMWVRIRGRYLTGICSDLCKRLVSYYTVTIGCARTE